MSSATIEGVFPRRDDSEVPSMFEDSLLESGGRRQKRSLWTTAASFALQSLVVGLLFLVPLFYTDTLPKPEVTTLIYAPPPPPPPPAAAPRRNVAPVKVPKTPEDTRLRTPTAIPKEIIIPKEPEAPPPVPGVVGGVVGGVPGGVPGGVLGGVLGGIGPALPKVAAPPPAPPQKIRVSSGVAEGNLIHDVRAAISCSCPPGPYSRRSGAAGRDRQRRRRAGPARQEWPSDAGAGGSRCRPTVALQAVLSERAAG